MQLRDDLILTFENNKKYFVICTTIYNNDLYAYLLDLSDEDNHIYVKQIKTDNENELKLEQVINQNIIKEISPFLAKSLDQ